MNSGTHLDQDSLRIEIAILQEDIDAYNPPKNAKFKIPALMTEDTIGSVHTSNKNIVNRRSGNIGSSSISMNNVLELDVPVEYTFSYGDKKIPKNTKFLVSLVGGNDNDIRIVGRYDKSKDNWVDSFKDWLLNTVLKDSMDTINNKIDEINNNISDINSDIDDLKNVANYLGGN